MGTRKLGLLLLGALVATALLVPGGGVVAWLIVRGRHLGTAEMVGVITLGVAVGAGIAAVIAAVFGPVLYQRWIDRRTSQMQLAANEEAAGPTLEGGIVDERKQDRLAMRDVLRGVKNELFSKRDA